MHSLNLSGTVSCCGKRHWPSRAIRALAARDPSITVVGAVPSVQPYLWRSAVCVAPLQIARGIQNKVLEGLAAGLPVVVTPAVFDGLPPAARPGCLVAERPGEFVNAVVNLLRQPPDERRRRAAASDLSTLSWSLRLGSLEGVLRRHMADT